VDTGHRVQEEFRNHCQSEDDLQERGNPGNQEDKISRDVTISSGTNDEQCREKGK
jgi:hypothetical protein